MLTTLDKKYLIQTFATKQEVNEKFSEVNEKLERLIFTVENLAQDHQFVAHHSSEHFEKNEEQDKRLDRIENKLNLPSLSF